MLLLALLGAAAATPATPLYYNEQLVDHFSADASTYAQRYYENSTWWRAPDGPIVMILGGEGAIEPSTGIFYPWVTDVVARELGAHVIEPEHRFYGASQPPGARRQALLSPQQALADAARLLDAARAARNCTGRDGQPRCPGVTFGGSYPGWLSAMMRARYPAVVDVAYAASAPMLFYSQQVDQAAYYARVTASAESARAGCSGAVRDGMLAVKVGAEFGIPSSDASTTESE